MRKHKFEHKDFLFAAFAGLLVLVINILTYLIALVGDWSNEIILYPVRSVLIQPLIWGILVFVSIPIFKGLPYYWKMPIIRIILWTPIVILDIWMRVRNPNSIAEYPGYFLYLNNEILLPFTSVISSVGDDWKNEAIRFSYFYVNVLIVFALFQAAVLRGALAIATKYTSINRKRH